MLTNPSSAVWAKNFGWLALAFAIRGLKEFGEPARKTMIIGEAPPAIRARTFGAYYLIRDSVVTTGSFVGVWLWSISPQANFVGAALCGAAGTIWFWWLIGRSSRGRSPSQNDGYMTRHTQFKMLLAAAGKGVHLASSEALA